MVYRLIGINAAQLVIALISNLSLLLNMARRIRVSIAQPITIIGWYLSSIALIGLTACAAGPLKLSPPKSYAFTQAYYYAIFAAGLYFLVATLMLINVWGAHAGHYEKEFQLTMSQRTLMLQTIFYFVYLLCGAVVFSYVENWDYLDAVYWADFTLLTVGIGDYSPVTHLGRALLFPFAIGGIIILGLVIGSIRSLVLERGKEKMSARMVEKERRRLIKHLEKKPEKTILEPISSSKPPSSSSSPHPKPKGDKSEKAKTPETERQRREAEFNLMRRIQETATTKRRWTSLIISGTVWFALWFVGAAIFTAAEEAQQWSYFGSLYFSYTSLLTIGYGDFAPQSNSGKPFFVFWSLLAVPSLTILISNMGDTIVKGIKDLTLWIGTITVLPGEHGVRAALKESANQLSRGRLFGDEVPPGFLGESSSHDASRRDQAGDKDDPESAAQHVQGERAKRDKKHAAQRSAMNDQLPESKPHFHHLLITEIAEVTKHLNAQPPRKYTFEEWAWYLKLVGEDESSADTHVKAVRNPRPDGEGPGVANGGQVGYGEREGEEKVEWSWVGSRSPLMGMKEEAEWVLERLIGMLERELASVRRESEGEWNEERSRRSIRNEQAGNRDNGKST